MLIIPPREKRLLLQHVLGVSQEMYTRNAPFTLDDVQQLHYDELLQRRATGEPIAKIIGRKAFWKHEFMTNIHTLDPRPESELIIEAVLKYRPATDTSYRFLDCGTGSGCLLLSLLHEYPYAQGDGIDILPHAISIATENAALVGVKKRAYFSILHWTLLGNTLYDIVTSNPPYIPTLDIASLMPDVSEYDPLEALDGGMDGLDAYKELFNILTAIIKPHGLFVCEIGIGQKTDVLALGNAAGMIHCETMRDMSGIPRVLVWKKP